MIALSLIGYVRRSQAVSSIVKVQVWHICYRLPLSLSKLLELWLFLLEELPDCWKRNRTSIQTNKPSLCIRHYMVRHYVTHCFSQPSFSQFWKHCKVTESMGPDIRRELSMPCFQFLNIWHVHLIFFEFIFFFYFYLLGKTKQHKLWKDFLVLFPPGVEFCVMNCFCRSSSLCYSAIKVSVTWWVRGYFVKCL